MGGLSYFQEGKSTTPDTEQETPAEETRPATVSGKATAVKGQLAFPTISGNVDIGPGVLEAMEQLYRQKQAQQNSFMEAMKDAAAWASGGLEGPTRGLALRGEERAKQQADMFNIQSQLAQYKAAQERSAAENERFFGKPTQTTAVGAGTATGEPQVAGAGVAKLNQATGGLLDLVQDPSLKMQIGAQYMTDKPKAMSQLNSYLAKRAEEPEVQKTMRYLINEGLDPKQALPIALTKTVGSGAFAPQEMRSGPRGTFQTTPLQEAQQFLKSAAVPGAAPTESRAPTSVTKPATAPPMGTAAPAVIRPVPAPANLSITNIAPTPAARQIAPAPAPTPVARQAAPVSDTAYLAGFDPSSKEGYELRTAQAKEQLRGVGEEAAGRGKTFAENAAKLEELAKSAPENIRALERMERILDETPRAVGIAYKPGKGSAAIKLVEEGIQGPFGISLKIPGMEEGIARMSLKQNELDNRAEFNTLAERAALQYRNEVNKGMGSVSNAENVGARVAFGLDVKSPAKANLIFTVLHTEKQKFFMKFNEGWVEFQKKEEAAGRTPSFGAYQKSDYVQKTLVKENDQAIRERLPDLFKQKTPETGSKFDKYYKKG